MHAIAALLIAEHIDDLRREAEAERRRAQFRNHPAQPNPIRIALATVLRRLAGALDDRPAPKPADARPVAA
jgi:hypothetical protein